MTSTKVLIVEDDFIIAKDIQVTLSKLGYKIVGVAHDSEKALDMLYSRKPDFVILDINIGGTKDGIDIAEVINEKYNLPFIYLTSYSDEHTLGRATSTKPYGYIVKPFEESDLKTSIAVAYHNFKTKQEESSLSKSNIEKHSRESLSDKEYQIILDISQGLSSSQIAEKQLISVNTVKFHLKNIYQKMEVSNKTELIGKIIK